MNSATPTPYQMNPKKMNPCRLPLFVPTLVIGLAIMIPESEAATLLIDGGWTIIESPEIVPLPAPGAPYVFDGGPWEMNPTIPVALTVTDLYVPGDLFEVWNNGILIGSGSGIDGFYSFADTQDAALGNPNFSQNSWILQPGTHSLQFKTTTFAPTFKNTSLAFKVESMPIPEGGSTLLLLLGMVLAGLVRVRHIR